MQQNLRFSTTSHIHTLDSPALYFIMKPVAITNKSYIFRFLLISSHRIHFGNKNLNNIAIYHRAYTVHRIQTKSQPVKRRWTKDLSVLYENIPQFSFNIFAFAQRWEYCDDYFHFIRHCFDFSIWLVLFKNEVFYFEEKKND